MVQITGGKLPVGEGAGQSYPNQRERVLKEKSPRCAKLL